MANAISEKQSPLVALPLCFAAALAIATCTTAAVAASPAAIIVVATAVSAAENASSFHAMLRKKW